MFSFKINKKTSSTSTLNKFVKSSRVSSEETSSKRAFQDDEDREDDEPDFIEGLDGTNILSKKKQKKPEKKALVIPLITKNEWRISTNEKHDEGHQNEDSDVKKDEGVHDSGEEKAVDTLQEQAVKELLDEATAKVSSNKKNSKTIPILFQNRVPEGYEEDDNMDVSLRPDQSSLDDYERIPIEEFGLAVLRGMGWKETEGIGLRNKKVVDMAEPKLRPKGMGLGAEAAHCNKDVVPKSVNSVSEDKEDLSFKIGGYAVVTKGSKKGYYGQIESFDEDNNRVIIRLGISGKMEAVSKFYINVVSAKEYKKNSKVINSEKYEEYKAIQDKKDKQRRAGESRDNEEPEESRVRKSNTNDYDSDDYEDYETRRQSNKNGRESTDYDYERKQSKRSRHRDRDDDRNNHKTSDRGKSSGEHTSSRYDNDRKRQEDRNRNDSYHKSSRNADRDDRDREHHRKKHKDHGRRYRD